MWTGLQYFPADEAPEGFDGPTVYTFNWVPDRERPLTTVCTAGQVPSVLRILTKYGLETEILMPRCDNCDTLMDVPNFDSMEDEACTSSS